jgi:site-specific recombinase XerD
VTQQHTDPAVGTARSLKPAEWPSTLCALWREHVEGKSLRQTSTLPDWAPATTEAMRRALSRYLGYIARYQPQRLHEPIEELCRPGHVDAYVEHLRETCRETSVSSYLLRLALVMRLLHQSCDYRWLISIQGEIQRKAARLRRPTIMSSQLHRIARVELEAVGSTLPGGIPAARAFRDALIFGVLTEAPMRAGSFIHLDVSDLQRVNSRWLIHVRAEHAKGGKEAEYELSDLMSSHIDVYLRDVRPRLIKPASLEALWPSAMGGRLCIASLIRITKMLSKTRLGVALSPHAFRRAAGAFIAFRDPANVLSVRDLLNHSDFRTTQKHYLPAARTRHAARYYASLLGVEGTRDNYSDARQWG